MQALGIPRVMPIIDSGFTSADQPWYAMPVAQPVNIARKSIRERINVIINITDTISQLHKEGMVHRDIKPKNLLVLNNEVVVSDFGLALIEGEEHLTVTGEQVGSVGYRGEECIGRSNTPRFSCDVYALGKTAWVLLTNAERPPIRSLREPEDSLVKSQESSSDLDMHSIQDLVFAATDQDPANRPSALQFKLGLEASLSTSSKPRNKSRFTPADRARSLFGSEADRNQRELDAMKIFSDLQQKIAQDWEKSWKETIKAIGWREHKSGGGASGKHAKSLPEGWRATTRHFFQGKINHEKYEIVLTFRSQNNQNPSDLIFGICLAIEKYANEARQIKDEVIIYSKDFNSFIKGPQFEKISDQLQTIVEDVELQFRTIEKLKEISSN